MTLNEESLEKRFNGVSTSQGSIQSLSFFCLHYKNHHKKIAQIWLRCLQKAKVSHRLTLIYLANDIVQNAKRKNILSFIEDFKSILKDTIPYLRDEKIKKSVERVFSIWQDRSIFDAKFTNELKAALNSDGRVAQHPHQHQQQQQQQHEPIKASTPDHPIMDCIGRLQKIKSTDIVDRLSQGQLTEEDKLIALKNEIDERTTLSKLLDSSLSDQRKMLKESEDQLIVYKSQLDYFMKLRDDLG